MHKINQERTESSDGVVSHIWVEYLSVDIGYANAVAENVATDHDVAVGSGRRRPAHND